jgi:PAS domain S-box-containing protein
MGEELAVSMMKAGANDYLMKDQLARLAPAVKREISDAQVRRHRREAEHSLRLALAAAEEGQRLLDAVFTTQTDGVLVSNAAGLVIRTNPAAIAFLGFDPNGSYIGEVVRMGRLAADVEASVTARALHGETVVGVESFSGERTVESSAAPMRDTGGAITGAVTIVRDITARKQVEEERSRSDRRYRSLFQHMRNGFAYCRMLYDARNRPVDFIPLEVNDAFEQLTGLRDVVGRRFTDVLAGVRESTPELFDVQGRVAATGEPASFELDFKPIGKWLSVSAYSPEKGHFVAIIDDITERKRQEADRDAMMGLLNLLNTPIGTRELIGAATKLLQQWSGCEAAAIRLQEGGEFPLYESRGFPFDCVADENLMCTPDEHGHLQFTCLCGHILSGKFDASRPYITPGGSFRVNTGADLSAAIDEVIPGAPQTRCHEQGFQSVAIVPLHSSGRALGLLQFSDRRAGRFTPEGLAQLERAAASLGIAIEQRRTQDALRASKERYRLISENTADVIWLLDVDSGRFTFVSPSVRNLLGYTPEELMESGVESTLSPETWHLAASRMCELVAAFHSGSGAHTLVQQMDQVRKDGSVVQTEVATTWLPNPQGAGGEILGVTRDITARAQAEARLLQAQKLESVGRLAGGVAHDFNNLITVINGYSEMVLDSLPPGDPLREGIDEIRIASQRATALSRQLLMLSRKQVVQTKAVNINEIVREVQSMLGRVIGEDIRLQSALSPEPGFVMADPGQLHQVLMNLAVNARDAMPQGGRLLLETANVTVSAAEDRREVRPGEYVRLRVTDTGTGMSKDVVAHLFEPFFTTKKVGEGTGLGLATVYGIVQQCGGSILVSSEPGQGASFEIHLPRIEPGRAAPEVRKPGASAMRGTETILLVEDQDQLRKMVTRVLRGRGYQVIEAANGDEALRHAESHAGRIDLMLTDIVMPGLSGLDLAVRLKAARPEIKIIFMSGYSERAAVDKESLDLAGAYLPKPVSPEALTMKVREVLDGPAHWPASRSIS